MKRCVVSFSSFVVAFSAFEAANVVAKSFGDGSINDELGMFANATIKNAKIFELGFDVHPLSPFALHSA